MAAQASASARAWWCCVRSYGLKPVVGQFSPENTAGSPAGTMKNILRVIHAVHLEHSPQTSLVERTVVGHQRQPFYQRSHLLPHIWKYRRISSILQGKAVYPGIPVTVILRLRPDKTVETVTTTPTLHTLVRCSLAVSKSMAAKSFMGSNIKIKTIA